MFTRPRSLLIALYSLTYLPMLFQKGMYWDAWMWIPEMFTYRNFAWMYAHEFAPLRAEHYYLIFRPLAESPDPIFTAHLIIFVSWICAGLLLYTILNRFLEFGEKTSFFLTAYYLVFPAFITRFEIVSGTYYSTANLAFMFASYLYLAPKAARLTTFIRESVAIPLFVWSFLCNSFPVFFFGFLAVHFYRFTRGMSSSLRLMIIAWARRYWYLPLLSFTYIAVKFFYLKPYGIGEHYNELIIARGDFSPLQMLMQFIDSYWSGLWAGFLWPLAASLSLLDRKYFALLCVILGAIVYVLVRKTYSYADERIGNHPLLSRIPAHYHAVLPIVIGAAFLFLALFPYAMAGKAPHIYGYGFAQRLSLLFPLGSAILLMSSVHILVREQFRKYVHLTLLTLFVSFIWYNSFLEDMDWYKQQAILHELPKIVTMIPPPMTFVFYDDTRGLNWLNRTVAAQEYTGYFYDLTGSKDYHGYNYFDWNKQNDESTTTRIRITSLRPDEARVSDWLALKFTELTNSKRVLRERAHERLQIVLNKEVSELQPL